MLYSLEGKRVLIIGGTGQMGLATAEAAANVGAEVATASRSGIDSGLPNVSSLTLDASSVDSLTAALDEVAPFDHIAVTVSANARASGIDSTNVEDAQRAFQRYWSCYNVLHTGHTFLTNNGSITLVSGSSGRRPVKGYGIWTALHGAIEVLAKAAAIDLAPQRINVVSPGGIEMQPDRQLAEHSGKAEDVGSMIVALMANPAITNTIVDVDSGERLGTWPSAGAVR